MLRRIIIAAIFILMLTLVGCSQKQGVEQANSTPTVAVVKTKSEQLSVEIKYDAVLELGQEQFIPAQIAGCLAHFYCDAGDEVRAGNRLALIENQGIALTSAKQDQEVEIAQIQTQKLQARAKELEKELERKRSLYQAGAIAQADLDKTELEWELLSQDIEQAARQRQLALIRQQETHLDAANCEIIAPDNLRLAEKMVKVGQFVNTGQPVFRAGKCDHLFVNIAVPKQEAEKWQRGDKLEAELQTEVREATIQSINLTTQPGSERIKVALRVENPNLDWLPGSMVKVKCNKEMGKQMLIPAEAIAQGEEPYVYIVKDQKAQRQKISLGTIEGSKVSVYGIPEGSLVVTEGLQHLRDGDTVNIKEAR